jgi:hypothetical protein
LRDLRPAHLAAGALIMGVPATAGVLAAGQASAQSDSAQGNPLPAKVSSRHVRFGHAVVVSGNAPASAAGQSVELEYAAAGQRTWRALSSGTIRSDGAYRLAAPVRHSGLVKVVSSSSSSQSAQTAAASPSGPQRIAVAASLRIPAHTLNVLGSQPAHIRGRLLPGVAGRRVRLQARSGDGWTTVSTARTGGRGRFDLPYSASAPGQRQLRVRFAGDRLNTWVGAHAGQVTVYRQSAASWYSDGGTTGCGFHATYGVANVSLPCGTQVRFFYGGRSVTATVDDRGPFVGGREWDLNQNTAAALGFAGVGTVWSSL